MGAAEVLAQSLRDPKLDIFLSHRIVQKIDWRHVARSGTPIVASIQFHNPAGAQFLTSCSQDFSALVGAYAGRIVDDYRRHFGAVPELVKISYGLGDRSSLNINIAIDIVKFPISKIIAFGIPATTNHILAVDGETFVVHSAKKRA